MASNYDPLHAEELRRFDYFSFDFEAQVDGLANAFHQRIERPCLGVAPAQFGDRRNEVPIGIPLDNDIEVSLFFLHVCTMTLPRVAVKGARSGVKGCPQQPMEIMSDTKKWL
jgi:hypothetical protein